MVEIYLSVHESQFSFLSIPLADVQRLAIRPFKWLRYVMYCICGARGDLYATLDGPPVDYDSTALANDAMYYYKPSGECVFVDYKDLHDQLTTTSQTDGRYDFTQDVVQRDKSSVITAEERDICDAAHLISWNKGDEYIKRVVEGRLPLYGGTAPSISSVNAVENGVLLRTDLHMQLSRGDVAYLKTPNYGLESADIQRVDQRPADMDTDHFTLHYLAKPHHYEPDIATILINAGCPNAAVFFSAGLNVDALFRGTGSPLPPAVILDYAYGAAAYKCWSSMRDVPDVMESYHRKYYADIPVPLRRRHSDDSDGPSDELNGPRPREDPGPAPTSPRRRQHMSLREGDEMAKAMDDMNAFLMFVNGITPEEAAKRREKRMEEEELKAQEASRSKVMEWMGTMDDSSS
ncbi:hypothetical protein EDB92DRAFT_1943830 [Lactarius akahatsu]|uniref:HNH nuclease domain-containing protein n=1 Tax=Lactarius akahatsu TaxID=416441 RepID=A0AAD4LKN7_9AGAM|nr:hypothetical protein EDB92DRAFT_1943830 [Lactarius akahatsu]